MNSRLRRARNLAISVAALAMSTVCGALTWASDATTSEEAPAGHSHQGEWFNEGPRQKAYLIGGTGDIDFPVTTSSEEAQAFFEQGVGQLHGYWYFEAERSFRQAAMLDPECAMAYWGMAQANVKNEERARAFIEQAYDRRVDTADYERQHIEAYHRFLNEQDKKKDKQRRLRYISDLEQIIHDHPDHIEARAMIGNFFHIHYGAGVKPTSAQAYEDLMQVVLTKQPLHPLHHFRVHLWDNVNRAELGLDAAAKCGPSAPSIAHMWHMPGHIYSKLRRYHDAAWYQEASARVDHRHMIHDLVLPDQIHNYAHNNEWLCRNLMNVGRVHDARALALNMVELPRHPKYNTLDKRGCSTSYGCRRLSEVLVRFEMWPEWIDAYQSGYLRPADKPNDQRDALHLLGIAQVRVGDLRAAEETIAKLEEMLEPHRTKLQSDDGEKKEGKKAAKKEIASIESRASEIRGLLLLEQGRHDEAADELAKVKNMDRYRLALAYADAGRNEKALEIAESLVENDPHQVLPAARAAYLFEACGEAERAGEVFEQLRPLAATADLDVPLFERLEPLAQRLELPSDWRLPREAANDVGERPDLDTLGPFRWTPPSGEKWAIQNVLQETFQLDGYTGRPVVVIFYLGHGCLHCVEQLHEFAPLTDEFRSIGIDLVGISTESQEQLDQAVETYYSDDEAMPFPLVCDPALDVFRRYRCYDDFEQAPLHGTFLFDAQGNIRWHDISFEPFADAQFLLDESQRLLWQQ